MARVKWHFDELEWFTLGGANFDVQKAKLFLQSRLRSPPIKYFTPIAYAKLIDTVIEVDWQKIKSEEVDLSVPVIKAFIQKDNAILLLYQMYELFPIDGWHRIAKAIYTKVNQLPFVYLSRIESRRILMR